MREPRAAPVATLWVRNAMLMFSGAGSLPLWLYGAGNQGEAFRFAAQDAARAKTGFTCRRSRESRGRAAAGGLRRQDILMLE
jgi:hypothetical protein